MSETLKGVFVNYNLRNKLKSNVETPLNCIVRWDKQRLVFSNVEKIKPKFFDATKQRAKNSGEFIGWPEFNTRLNNIESKIKDTFRTFQNDNNRNPDVAELREMVKIVLGKAEPAKIEIPTFFKFLADFVNFADHRISTQTKKPLTYATKRHYQQVKENLEGFNKVWKEAKAIRENIKQDDLRNFDFADIDLQFYSDYKNYLINVKEYQVNTWGKHIKTFKSILSDAASRGLTTNQIHNHRDFIGSAEQVDNIYLNEAELNKIAKLDLTNSFKLDRVRDLFLIGCYTGLRFSDFVKIPASCIDIENRLIRITTHKTAKPVVIPIHKTVLGILAKYNDKTENSLPPALSNAKMNEYLKEVAEMAELNDIISKTETKGGLTVHKQYKQHELVCTHTARRSFATNTYKMGVPIYDIMAITGHTREQTFKNYIKITASESANVIAGYWNRQEMAAV